MIGDIPYKEKKIAFLENILNFAKNNPDELLIKLGKERLTMENGKIIFVSDHAPIDEGCHIYLKLDENSNPFFHIRKTMNYKALNLSEWDNKDCLTAEEALDYARRYLPHDYQKFTEEVRLELD